MSKVLTAEQTSGQAAELAVELTGDLKRALTGDVRFDPYSKVLYSTDASSYQMSPVGVVLPRTTDEVAAAVAICARHGVPVLPRGAGSSLAGQAVGHCVHIDFSKYLFELHEVNAEARWVRCAPGVSCDGLNRQLKPFGLMFGPDPASSERATAGGMVANNSTGAHSILYGMAGDHVRAARVVLSDGSETTFTGLGEGALAIKLEGDGLEGHIYREVQRLVHTHRETIHARWPRTWRRASGYSLNYMLPPAERTATFPPTWDGPLPDDGFNLARLLASSEGTLAVATELTLNLVPRPAMTALTVVHFDDLIRAAEATTTILECSPSAVELIDDTLIDLARGVPAYARMLNWVSGRPRAVLVVEFYGESDTHLLAQIDRLETRLRAEGLSHTFMRAMTAAQQADVWGVRKVGLGLLASVRGDHKPLPFMEDVAVPVAQLASYLTATQRIFEQHGLRSAVYAHASAGCLHIRPMISLKTVQGVTTMRAVAEAVLEEVLARGGSMSGEHGDGLSRSEWNARLFGPELYEAFRALKRAFDPRGMLNPGKVVDAPPMDQNLRYGPNYQTLQVATRMDFTLEGGLAGAVEQCNGAGVCRKTDAGTMCPSYMVTREEQHSTRGRANALRAALSGRLPREELYGEGMFETFDLCLECKACKAECPSAVDIAKVKYEWLAHFYDHHGLPLRARIFAGIHTLSRVGAMLAPLVNPMVRSRLGRALQARMGLHPKRTLPAFASEPFDRWFRQREPAASKGPRVILFHDTFTTYNHPEVGRAAVRVLEAAGYDVELVEQRACCGRPMISKGQLGRARAALAHNVALLAPAAEQGVPIVGLEPSCILTFRDEGPDLLHGDARARVVGQHAFLLEEFLALELDAGRWPRSAGLARLGEPYGVDEGESVARAEEGLKRAGEGVSNTGERAGLGEPTMERRQGSPLLVHGHCHQKAMVGMGPLMRVLEAAGYAPQAIDSGCCGMAGSFGYESEHYEISMAIGEQRLFPAVRAAAEAVTVVAPGFSCRQQIAHATGRRALHPAEVLARALE